MPKLKAIASVINTGWPGYHAQVIRGRHDTDHRAGRLRAEGDRPERDRIVVWRRVGVRWICVHDCHADADRMSRAVDEWVAWVEAGGDPEAIETDVPIYRGSGDV